MKKFLKVALCFSILAFCSPGVEAQGLGGLIKKGKAGIEKGKKAVKKGKEAVESVLGTEEAPAAQENQGNAVMSSIVSSSGIAVSNPLGSVIEIEPVGLYGVSKSENYGDAYLVLKVKKLTPKETTSFGSEVKNQKMIAVDNSGKVYNVDAFGQIPYDTPEGLMVQVVLDNPALMFNDIKKNVDMMQQVKLGVFSDKDNQGMVTFTNVPIFWDQSPE